MRYPQAKIKEAILHPEIEIRNRAVRYFAEAFSPDPSIMPLVIQAVETHGRRNDAYRLVGSSRNLVQSADTISWVIDELDAEETGTIEHYAYNLTMVLVDADPALVAAREADILNARHFLPDLRALLTDRVRMLSWDAAQCWRRLEELAEEAQRKQSMHDVSWSAAESVVDALSRHGQECESKIRDLLAVDFDDDSDDPMMWAEPLVVRLAGKARLESTIPQIIAKLQGDYGDVLNEQCADALTRIGSPAVLHAVAAAFPAAQEHFRIYATNPLEHIHSDLAVEVALKLFAAEKDDHIRCELAQALLCQFAHEGIEVARQFLAGRELNFIQKGLWSHLLETCALTGERFPEYEAWTAQEKAEQKEHHRRVKELEGDPLGMLRFAFEKLAGPKALDRPNAAKATASTPRLLTPRKPVGRMKAGRNDPCPCGSGKKFKVCCLRR